MILNENKLYWYQRPKKERGAVRELQHNFGRTSFSITGSNHPYFSQGIKALWRLSASRPAQCYFCGLFVRCDPLLPMLGVIRYPPCDPLFVRCDPGQCFPDPAFFKLTWLWLWVGSGTLTLILIWLEQSQSQSQVRVTVTLEWHPWYNYKVIGLCKKFNYDDGLWTVDLVFLVIILELFDFCWKFTNPRFHRP